MPELADSCPTDDDLAAYVGHAESVGSAIERHLDDCALCRSAVAELAILALPERSAITTLPAASTAAAPQAITEGTRVGRYVVRARVGAGAMGTVYIAHDPELDREVALKLLHPSLCVGAESAAFRARVAREARAMARLSHPEVVAVYDAGPWGDQLYIAMELVRGRTLRAWLAAEPRSRRAILDVLRRAGRGLAAAHAAGIVHRDFKPDNVLVGDDGRVRVTDFGLARTGHDGGSPTGESAVRATTTTDTEVGTIIGTPAYMAPEQIEGRSADVRSDVFAFCVSLHEALYGVRPFIGSTARDLADSARRGAPEAPRGSKVPAWIRRPILRGLRADPEERYPSMDALLADLAESPWVRRARIAAAFGVALLVGVAAIAGYVARRAPMCEGGSAEVAAVWSDARREEVRRAFAATGVVYAEQTWGSVARGLDAWALSWARMSRDACLAHARHEETDALFAKRTACLARRLDRTRATVDVLSRADAEVARKAARAVEELPPLAECADAEALLAPIPPPRPEDAPRIAAVLRQLDRAEATELAGKYADALAIFDGALAGAKAIGYAPLVADAAFQRASLLVKLERPKEQEAALLEALWAAEAGRVDTAAARAWIWLISAAADQERFEDAHRNAGHAAAAVARLGGSTAREADLDSHLGLLAQHEGKYADAIRHFERDLEYRERSGAGAFLLAGAHRNVGIAAARLGELSRAEAEIRKSIEILEKALGAGHPDTLAARSPLPAVLAQQGRLDEAIEAARALRAQQETALGAESESVLTTTHNLAETLTLAGRSDEALAELRRSVVLVEKLHGADSVDAAEAHGALAAALFGAGQRADAAAEADRVVRAFEQRLGPDHPKVGIARDNLGFMLLALGQVDAALAEQRRAIAIAEKSLGPDHPQLGGALTNLGHDLRAKRQFPDAILAYERALAILDKKLGRDHPTLGEPLTGIGLARLATGAPKEAVAPLERAIVLREKGDPLDLAETEQALADALEKSGGDRARAKALAESARARRRRANPSSKDASL